LTKPETLFLDPSPVWHPDFDLLIHYIMEEFQSISVVKQLDGCFIKFKNAFLSSPSVNTLIQAIGMQLWLSETYVPSKSQPFSHIPQIPFYCFPSQLKSKGSKVTAFLTKARSCSNSTRQLTYYYTA